MTQQLTLKSKITQNCGFDSIDISPFAIPLKADEQRYRQDLKKFCRKFAKKIQADDVAEDDMVSICCQSENPRFQKERIVVRSGLGLYSKELEEAIVGMKVGESRNINVQGSDVCVTVLSSERQLVPPLTDSLAAHSGIEGIKNAEDAREYCRFKQYDDVLEECFDEAYSFFSKELLGRCRFSFDEEELEAALSCAKKSISPNAGENPGNEEAEDFNLEDFTQKLSQSMLTAAVFGQELGAASQKDYEEYIRKTAIASECSLKEAREAEPLPEYLIFTYSDIFIEKTEKYVLNKLKKLGEKKYNDNIC